MNTIMINYNTVFTFRDKFSKFFFLTTLPLGHKYYYNFGSFPILVLLSLAYVSISTLLLFKIKIY